MVSAHFTLPPPTGVVYAPMDIAKWVAEGLTARGHEVDLFAPVGSSAKVRKVIDLGLNPLKQDDKILSLPNVGQAEKAKIFGLWDEYLIAQMFNAVERGEYDIIHVHPVDRALPIALSHPEVPIFYTLHDPIFEWRAEIFKMFSSPNQYFVSISDAQRKPAPDLNYAGTVYNGIDMNLFPFSEKGGEDLLFVGRINPNKGVAEAVQAAIKADARLLIVGTPNEGAYWDEKIKPFLNDKIKSVGFVPYNELYKYYGSAKALLVPIQWEEPFGLVMAEAMACGTPVIAFNRGSVPEVVADGKTGFVVNTIDEMVEAIGKVDGISRADCRKHVEEKFSVEKMIEGYEKIFLDKLAKGIQRGVE